MSDLPTTIGSGFITSSDGETYASATDEDGQKSTGHDAASGRTGKAMGGVIGGHGFSRG